MQFKKRQKQRGCVLTGYKNEESKKLGLKKAA
jgi:hypothetical protein